MLFRKNWTTLYFLFLNSLILSGFLLIFYYKFSYTIISEVLTLPTIIFSYTMTILAIFVSVISWTYLSERYMFKYDFFIFYFFIFTLCTILMVFSINLLQMFVYFEFIFLPSLFFVYQLGYSKKTPRSVTFLLTWTLSGSFLVLMSLSYLYSSYACVDITYLRCIKFSNLETLFLFLIFFIGFAVKIPAWPFYYWLTKVHVEAPTGFSIFLSGFLVKTAFFCLTFFYFLFYNFYLNLIFLGIVIWGGYDSSIRMWGSLDIKKLIAFATVQEMNLIIVFLLLSYNSNLMILNIFLLIHGILSAFFFFLVDQVQKITNTRNFIVMCGLSLFAPLLGFLVWLGLLIFRGFPTFVKFFVEWELLHVFYVNFKIVGFFLFFLYAMFAVNGFAKVWLSVIYGVPNNLFSASEVLKKDFTVGITLSSVLVFLGVIIIFFYGWCFA